MRISQLRCIVRAPTASLDPLRRHVAPALMKNEPERGARLPRLERDLRVDDLVEKAGGALGENLELRLPRQLRERPPPLARDVEMEPRRDLVPPGIAREDRRIDRDPARRDASARRSAVNAFVTDPISKSVSPSTGRPSPSKVPCATILRPEASTSPTTMPMPCFCASIRSTRSPSPRRRTEGRAVPRPEREERERGELRRALR